MKNNKTKLRFPPFASYIISKMPVILRKTKLTELTSILSLISMVALGNSNTGGLLLMSFIIIVKSAVSSKLPLSRT
jgi:hypothetical protein